jgi:hypothetical protein
MQQVLQTMIIRLLSVGRRAPAVRFCSADHDWLPPVLGPGDWSSATMASMADASASWYFDRAGRLER